jgi:hypothetical protein
VNNTTRPTVPTVKPRYSAHNRLGHRVSLDLVTFLCVPSIPLMIPLRLSPPLPFGFHKHLPQSHTFLITFTIFNPILTLISIY